MGNVGANPYKGPKEAKLEQAIADMDPDEIDTAVTAWEGGRVLLADVETRIEEQARALEADGTFGAPGREAAKAYRMVNAQVAIRKTEMATVATALTEAAAALRVAQAVTLSPVQPPANFDNLASDAPANLFIREQAKQTHHDTSLVARERESQTAIDTLDEKLGLVAEKLREVTGEREPVTDPNGIPTAPTRPTSTLPGPSLLTRPPDLGTGGPGGSNTGGPDLGTVPDQPETPFPGDDTEHGGQPTTPPGVLGPQIPTGPGGSGGPGQSGQGGLGAPAATGLAAGLVSTAASVAAIRRTPGISGLAPGSSTALGRSTTAATRGNLGRPGMVPGQGGTPTRVGTARTGGRALVPGQGATSRGSSGQRGASAVAGTSGRSGRRSDKDQTSEALAYDDEQVWLDDDTNGAAVLD